jgi:hypothetical protein
VAGTGLAGPFSQPRFFPGQLLTEDDLQAIVRYTVGKRRLTNHFLHGDGVVCGLVVHCAGKGAVGVTPGYALDCCGNDIVVECPEVIDVNALAAQLPSGASCVDPCEAKLGSRTYYLVVEYVETPSDPTAPYQTDDCSTATGCEFARMQEGYRFALRCDPPPADGEDVIERAKRCVEASAKRLAGLRGPARFTRAVVSAGRRAFEDVEAEAERLENDIAAADPAATADSHLAGLASRLARLAQANLSPSRFQELKAALERLLDAHEIPDTPSSIARRFARRITSRATSGAPTFDDATHGIKLALDPTELRQLADVLREHRDWLLCEEAKVELVTDCELRLLLENINVSSDDPELLERAFEQLYEAHQRLIHQCLCAAVLVPCEGCDDLAVYLASITVRECAVVEVCNLVRRHVISAPLLRSWLPIGRLEQALRSWCCSWHPAPLDLDITPSEPPAEEPEPEPVPIPLLTAPPSLVESGTVSAAELGTVAEALFPGLLDLGRRLGVPAVMRDVRRFTRSPQPVETGTTPEAVASTVAEATAGSVAHGPAPRSTKAAAARKKAAAKKPTPSPARRGGTKDG